MNAYDVTPRVWWRSCRWTIGLTCLMLVLNWGHLAESPAAAGRLLNWLQFDRDAIMAGEFWRVVTGNLVHWSREHFWLDVGAFLIIGLLYEPKFGRRYPWLLLSSAAAVGISLFVFQPDLHTYRGLSGVDSGQFAGAVAIECLAAMKERRRWIWVAPAATIFCGKIGYEALSGRLFFGTESLGNIGQPVPLAHVAGVLATGAYLAVLTARNSPSRTIVSGTAEYVCPWRLC